MGLHFLKKVRHVDVLYYVLRAFDSEEVTAYTETVDPVQELLMVQQELMMHVSEECLPCRE